MLLMSHPYKTRNQNFHWSSDTPGTATSVATSENIRNLETKLLSGFYELTKKLLNIKDAIMKNLQVENERLREKVSNLESKVTSSKVNQKKLEQHRRRNNIEVSGIPDSVEDNCLEGKTFFCVYQYWYRPKIQWHQSLSYKWKKPE